MPAPPSHANHVITPNSRYYKRLREAEEAARLKAKQEEQYKKAMEWLEQERQALINEKALAEESAPKLPEKNRKIAKCKGKGKMK